MNILAGSSPAKKALRAFLVAFAATFLTAVLPLLDKVGQDATDKGGVNLDRSALTAALLSVAVGALAAGLRAVLAYLPVGDG